MEDRPTRRPDVERTSFYDWRPAGESELGIDYKLKNILPLAINPPEAGALVIMFWSGPIPFREMCEERQSGKSKYRPASIGRLSLDDRFRIKERAAHLTCLSGAQSPPSIGQVTGGRERVGPSRSRRRLNFRDGRRR